MSTKIYEGLRLKDPGQDIFEVLGIVADSIEKDFNKLAHDLVREEIVTSYDLPSFRSNAVATNSLYFAVQENWVKRQESYGNHHRLNDPLRFSIAFSRASNGHVLAVPFFENSRYRKTLKRVGLFKEYGYWNNTDRPGNVSAKEWKDREEAWNSVLSTRWDFTRTLQWELPQSNDPFMQILLGDLRKQGRFNYNTPADLEKRKKACYYNAIAAAGDFKNSGAIFNELRKARVVLNELIESETWGTLPNPEPIPDVLKTRMADLPPAFVPDEAVVAEAIEKFKLLD